MFLKNKWLISAFMLPMTGLALAEDPAVDATAPVQVASYQQTNDLLPPNPRPGECYARVVLPARYAKRTETLQVREAGEKIEIIPAAYQKVREQVLIREATTRVVPVPAVYETVTERVEVQPEVRKVVQIPPKYKTVVERVVDKPAHTVWKRGTGIGQGKRTGFGGAAQAVQTYGGLPVLQTRVQDTGEVMCLVEVPATYREIRKQVLVQPASTREEIIPAKYGLIKKRVVKEPATTRTEEIPAQYGYVEKIKQVREAQEVRVPIPAQFKTVERVEKVNEERVEWRSVLCEINMTQQNVSQLQSALKSQGCYNCPVDGVMGTCTLRGAQCFARPRGLPYGSNFISIEVVRALGLNLQ